MAHPVLPRPPTNLPARLKAAGTTVAVPDAAAMRSLPVTTWPEALAQ